MTKNWTIAIALNILIEDTHEAIRGVVSYGGFHPGLQFRDVKLLDDSNIPRMLHKHACDGAIVTITRPGFEVIGNELPAIPMVNMGADKLSDAIPAVCGVRGAGSKVLIAHLQDQGYESFAYLGFDQFDLSHRGGNLKRLLSDAGCSLAELWLPGSTYEDLQDSHLDTLRRWLSELLATGKRTAVITYDGYRAGLVVEACQELQIDIPQQIGVATYTESRVCHTTTPTITGIETPFFELGFAAASLLHSMLKGETPPIEPVEVASPSVNVRGSTAPLDVFCDEIEIAREFMEKNFTKNICVDDCLAQLSNITRDNFFRSFKAQTGTTPAQYLQQLKMNLAKQMLLSTTFSMTRIAEICGFTSHSHFGRAFRRAVGQGPREFRQGFGRLRGSHRDADSLGRLKHNSM